MAIVVPVVLAAVALDPSKNEMAVAVGESASVEGPVVASAVLQGRSYFAREQYQSSALGWGTERRLGPGVVGKLAWYLDPKMHCYHRKGSWGKLWDCW